MFAIIARRFPNWYFFSVALSQGACSPRGFFHVLILFFFSCNLSIQHFWFDLPVSMFYSRIVVFLLHLVADLSLSIFHHLVWRIFFRYFARSCSVFIAWPCPDIFWVFILLPIMFNLFLPIVLSVVPFWGSSHPFGFLCVLLSLIVSRVIAVSLFVLLVSFPIQVLYFCLDSFGGY